MCLILNASMCLHGLHSSIIIINSIKFDSPNNLSTPAMPLLAPLLSISKLHRQPNHFPVNSLSNFSYILGSGNIKENKLALQFFFFFS